jgi:hypothetical protein
MATASKRRRQADRFTRTSNLTLAEIAQAETLPDPLPTEYHGLVNLLRRYVELLRHMEGERSGHFVEVMRIMAELNARQFIFEALTRWLPYSGRSSWMQDDFSPRVSTPEETCPSPCCGLLTTKSQLE